MATSIRYYPPGFVGTEQAILRIAKARYPDRWRPEAMSEAERSVWGGINKTFNGLVLDTHLPISIDRTEHGAAYTRLVDFSDAMTELRRALHAGQLTAQYCDEAGRFGTIEPELWGGDGAVDALQSGIALLDYGTHTYTRLVLIPEPALDSLASVGSEAAGCSVPVPTEGSLPRDPIAPPGVPKIEIQEPRGEPAQAKPLHPLLNPKRRKTRRLLEALVALRGENLGLGDGDVPALAAQVKKWIRDANSAAKAKRDQDIPADAPRSVHHLHEALAKALREKG